MEKRTPTYDLKSIQTEFSEVEYLRMTNSALDGAEALGIDPAEMVEVIQMMQRSHLYKSMTSNRDVGLWQDVYRVPYESGFLYVKFTVGRDGRYLLLSFKQL